MKNIVAIAGSNHKESRTCRLLTMWLQALSERDKTITYEVLSLRDYSIKMCAGCATCFQNGDCVLDKKDDLFYLKEKMRDSDIIVFSSPVYCNNLSGIMKNFIDRLALYQHTLDLSKKLGFTLATTALSGGPEVSAMLKSYQRMMGVKNLSNFLFKSKVDDEIASINSWANRSAEQLALQFNCTDYALESRFSSLKNDYLTQKSQYTYEMQFWRQAEVQACLSFQEFAAKYKSISKPVLGHNKGDVSCDDR